jgi:glutathione S-transferase
MPQLQIIGAPFSNFVWTCRIACAEKGVPYELVAVAPHTPEVKAIHPFGRIPVMRHGEIALCESRAICTYIDRAFDGPSLVPTDAPGAARTEQWVSLLLTTIDPVCMRQYVVGYVFPGTPDKSPNRPMIEGALPRMEKQLGLLDRTAAGDGHLAEGRFTLADAYLVPILYYLAQFPESRAMLDATTGLRGYLDRHMARPSVAGTRPPPMPA